MSKKQDLAMQKEIDDIVKRKSEIEESRIDRSQTSLLSVAQYKLDTDKSFYDNMQNFIDYNFDKNKFKDKIMVNSGVVVYEDRTHKTEIVFEGNFEPIELYNFNAQTEKIKDVLEEHLVTQYLETQNPTLFIDLKTLSKEVGIRVDNLRQKIQTVVRSLETIRISYTTKGRLKNTFTDFASIRFISSSEYHIETDLLEINFDNKYAYNLATHKFFQLPKKYRQINDNSFPYAYPLAKYVFELIRHNRTKIQFKSLYEQIQKIPRIEKIKEQRGSPTAKIYEPVQRHFNELNKKGDFTISFADEDFLIQGRANKNIDFDKMLETDVIITWHNKPDYTNTLKKKERLQKRIEEQRNRQIANAIAKGQLNKHNNTILIDK